jgi:hypothetical protein
MCLRSHIINGLLTSFCSVCTGKYLRSVYPHRPRSFVARSVRKLQANTFPYRPRPRLITLYYYMANITSGEMANCYWLRSTFSGPLFPCNGPAVHYVKTNECILKQNSKTNWKLQFNLILIRYLRMVFSVKEGIHWYFLFSSTKCVPRY